MTVDPDFPRRVSQARHDIDDLYVLHVRTTKSVVRLEKAVAQLEETQREQGASLVRLEGSVDRLEETQREQGASLVRLEKTQLAQGELLAEVLDILRAGRG